MEITMTNVLLAASTTTTTALGSITATAQAVEHIAKAGAHYASALNSHAEDYANSVKRNIADNADDIEFDRKVNRSLARASRMEQIEKQITANPRLYTLFKEQLGADAHKFLDLGTEDKPQLSVAPTEPTPAAA